jgi:DNA (cytosine-5)-methyltransferase 1
MEVLEPIKINHVFQYGSSQNTRIIDCEGLSCALTNGEKDGMPKIIIPEVIQVGNIVEDKGFSNPQRGRVYDAEGLSPAICTMQSGETEPKVIVEEYYTPSKHNDSMILNTSGIVNTVLEPMCSVEPTIVAMRGRNPYNPSERGKSNGEYKQRLEMNDNGTTNTITSVQKDNLLMECTYRIRKLTPRECYRLMGVDDADIDTIQSSGISNTQQYKQAGNSIVVDVLYHIFRKMFVETESESRQLEFF